MKQLFYIFFIGFFLFGFSAVGQTQKQLEAKRKRLQKEIKRVERILSKTKRKKSNALDDLKDLNQKITVRERLINVIKLEANQLSRKISNNEKKIKQNNNELKELKEEYADMVFKSYKSRSQQSKTMFILSSKNFLQAYKRLKYLEQYKEYRKKQGEDIIIKTELIKNLNDSLALKRKAKNKLLADREKQRKEIEVAKKEQEKVVATIKEQESEYKKQLQNKIKEEKRVTAKINKIIRDAIAKANKGKKAKTKDKFVLSAEEKTLKAKFEQNKGSLPWPVDGIITRRFGVQPHPTFKSIKINSTGLHIRAKENDKAKAIFNGKVLVVQLLSKGRKSVFVQHGNYITTYTNLEEVYVKKGDVIKTGDKLGKIFTDKITGKTLLQFILSENTKKLDPENWIKIK